MHKTSTTKQNQNDFSKKIKEINNLMKKNPESLSEEQKIIFELNQKKEEYEKVMQEQIKKLENERKKLLKEQEEINEERGKINEEWDEINEEWDEIYNRQIEIQNDYSEINNSYTELNNSLILLKEELPKILKLKEFYKQHKDYEKDIKNDENFGGFDKLQAELSKAQDEFNNAIEFIQKNKDTLSNKGIEIPNRISKHFESLKILEKRALYRIGIIGGSDKTNKVFNGWKKNRQGSFGINSNQLELLGDYNKQHDNKFAKQIHDSLEFNDLDFIIFLQSDHETKLIELEKEFPNRVTILGRRGIDNNDSSIQRFSNGRFLHYLEQALEKYEGTKRS